MRRAKSNWMGMIPILVPTSFLIVAFSSDGNSKKFQIGVQRMKYGRHGIRSLVCFALCVARARNHGEKTALRTCFFVCLFFPGNNSTIVCKF